MPVSSIQLARRFAAAVIEGLGLERWPQRTYEARSIVLHRHTIPTSICYVESGRLHASYDPASTQETVVHVSFGPGEFALTSSLYGKEPLEVDLVASVDTKVRLVERSTVERYVDEHDEVRPMLIRLFAHRLREAQSRERAWLERDVRGRVVAALNRAVTTLAASDRPPWRIVLTHEQLAEWAGVSRPKASVELKRLEGEGLLRLHRGAIEVLKAPDEQ